MLVRMLNISGNINTNTNINIRHRRLVFGPGGAASAPPRPPRALPRLAGPPGERGVSSGFARVRWFGMSILSRENPGARRSYRNVPRRLPHGQVPLLLMLSLKPG